MIQDVISSGIFMVAVILATVAVVAALGALFQAGSWCPKGIFPILFPLIVFGFGMSALLSGRSLSEMDALFSGIQEEQGSNLVVWINRIISLLSLAICLERCIRYAFVTESRVAQGWALFWAFVAYALGNVFLNGVFGTRPDFSHRYVYPVIAVLAGFLFAQNDAARSVRYARTALLILFVASAILVFVKPALVIQPNYKGLIPGLSFRYWGLSPHANSLGPLAVIFILCLWTEPFSSRWLTLFGWLLGLLTLLLSQSKTSYLVFMACTSILIAMRVGPRLKDSLRRNSLVPAALMVGVMFLVGVISISFMFFDVLKPVERFLATRAGGEVLSLTGRDVIWSVAISEWSRNYWFGYGPAMWDLLYRTQIGMLYAFHAHNQFLQSLGSGGLIGAGTFSIYAIMLLRAAIKSARASRGLSLALVVLLLIRAITEAPFLLGGFGGAEFFVHLLAFVVCAGYANGRERAAGASTIVSTTGFSLSR